MKRLLVVALLVWELAMGGCGSNTTTTAATASSGLWQAVLAGSANGAVLSFNTDFTVNGDGSLSVSQFNFLTAGPCFVSGQTETGTSTLTTDSAGTITGPISFVVTSGSPSGNTLTLTGNETTATSITGSWTLTGGTGCTGDGGSFTMTKSS